MAGQIAERYAKLPNQRLIELKEHGGLTDEAFELLLAELKNRSLIDEEEAVRLSELRAEGGIVEVPNRGKTTFVRGGLSFLGFILAVAVYAIMKETGAVPAGLRVLVTVGVFYLVVFLSKKITLKNCQKY